MKFLLLASALLFIFEMSEAQQPLTITRQNFQITATSDTLADVNPAGVALPVEGTNQVWDYSKIGASAYKEASYAPANNPSFQNAFCVSLHSFESIAAGRGTMYDEYMNLTNNYFGGIGISVAEAHYGIGDLTLNPNDSLIFPLQNNPFQSPRYVVKFPCTFRSVMTSSYARDFNFSLTINAFSLNNAPAKLRAVMMQIDSVVGWGKLLLPLGKGATPPIDVLLVKRYTTEVDSFFLKNAPAPVVLLNAFQLTQGMTTKTGRYMFWRANAKAYALGFLFGDQNFISATDVLYDKSVELLPTNVQTLTDNNVQSFVYPNPSATGNFTINFDKNIHLLVVRNMLGQEIMRKEIDNNTVQFSLPTKSIHGMYFYQLEDVNGKMLLVGKLMYVK